MHTVPVHRPALGRNLVTELPGPRSRELAARREAAVAAPLTPTMPVFAAAAGPGTLLDVDGNTLVDLGSGYGVTTVGNAAPRVVAAVRAQAEAFTHTCFANTPYEGYVALAERLGALAPGSAPRKAAFFNSGAEAVENAVKIARTATGRGAVVSLDHAFHGRTNLTLALTGQAAPYKRGFGPFAPDLHRVPSSYPFRDGLSGEDAAARTIDIVERQIGGDTVAALIVEPIQGEGGIVVPAPGYLPALADWARARGVLLIADEIQSGVARTGDFFAAEHEGLEPDLITVAKGIAGGLPLSGVIGRAELMDSVPRAGLGSTYGGNPVACAAALAVLDTIEEDGLLQRARELGARLGERLTALAQADPRIGEARGRGAMQGIELVRPGTTVPDPELARAVAARAHARGVLLLVCGTYGNVIRFLPPLVIPDEVLEDGLDVVAEALAATR